jgi:hypothetical protein
LIAAEANPPPVAEPKKSKGGVVSKKRGEEGTFVHMTWLTLVLFIFGA